MASHGISWVPGAHVRFGDLDFIITAEGELTRALVVVQPFHSTSLDSIAEVLEQLRLHATGGPLPRERSAPRLRLWEVGASAWHLLGTPAVLGEPTPPHLLIRQHHGTAYQGEPLSPEYLIRSAPIVLPFGLRNATETMATLWHNI